MGHRVIDQRRPQQAEDQEGLEADALHKRAGDQRRGDHRKHHLVSGEEQEGDGGGVVRVWRRSHAGQPQVAQAAHESAHIGAERQGEAEQNPLQADERHHDEAEVQRGEHVLLAHHSAVEERQSRGHHQHQRGGDQNPGGVACVDTVHV